MWSLRQLHRQRKNRVGDGDGRLSGVLNDLDSQYAI
jgi:hypothetical protein